MLFTNIFTGLINISRLKQILLLFRFFAHCQQTTVNTNMIKYTLAIVYCKYIFCIITFQHHTLFHTLDMLLLKKKQTNTTANIGMHNKSVYGPFQYIKEL